MQGRATAARSLVGVLLLAESEPDRVEARAPVCPRGWTWAAVRGAALDEPKRRQGAHGASGSGASASAWSRPRSAAEIADRRRSVNRLRGFPSLCSVTARLPSAGARLRGDAAGRRSRSDGGSGCQQREQRRRGRAGSKGSRRTIEGWTPSSAGHSRNACVTPERRWIQTFTPARLSLPGDPPEHRERSRVPRARRRRPRTGDRPPTAPRTTPRDVRHPLHRGGRARVAAGRRGDHQALPRTLRVRRVEQPCHRRSPRGQSASGQVQDFRALALPPVPPRSGAFDPS